MQETLFLYGKSFDGHREEQNSNKEAPKMTTNKHNMDVKRDKTTGKKDHNMSQNISELLVSVLCLYELGCLEPAAVIVA